MNTNLTSTTALTPCYNSTGELWAVRIAKGQPDQPGAGQFTGAAGLEILQDFAWDLLRAVTLLDEQFMMTLTAAVTMLIWNQINQCRVRGSVLAEQYRVVQPAKTPLGAAKRHIERQERTVDKWIKPLTLTNQRTPWSII